MNINTYLKQKLAEKNIQVDTLISASGSSKSTIYRVMNGLQMPSNDLKERLINILDLTSLEQKELSYYFSTANLDNNVIKARQAVFDFLFASKTNLPNKIELVYYDEEKYIRSFDTILENIVNMSIKDDFSCQMKLINCINDDVILPLSATIEQLSLPKCDYMVEHLVNFSSYDHKENVETLAHIIPLLTLENYILKYHEEEKVANYGFFHDFLMIKYRYRESNNKPTVVNLYISFLPNRLSTCYVIYEDDKNVLDFFERNYNSLLQNYQPALSSRKGFMDYVSSISDMYMNFEVSIFRPHIPLSHVPLSVYESVLKRTPVDKFISCFPQDELKKLELAQIRQSPKNLLSYQGKMHTPSHLGKEDIEAQVNALLSLAQSVIGSTYHYKQLDLYTKSGLESFAATGIILDHLDILPPFNKEEITAILQNLKSRDADPEDPFLFYITEQSYVDNAMDITTMDNGCLLIERYIDTRTPYCVIEHKKLSSIFADFANHYVPAMIAIPQEEAYAFIDYLIETYGKS